MLESESGHKQAGMENEEIRRQRVHSLMGQPLADTMRTLFVALGDESWRVRREAIEVIACSNPDTSQVKALVELMRDDENAGLRNATAEAVMRMGLSAVPALLPYLDDTDQDIRKFIVDALSAIGGPEVMEGLVKALDDQDVNVAAAAAEGLGGCGGRGAVAPLLRALEEHHHDFFRFNVLEALGKVGVPSPLPAVIKELSGREMLRRAVYQCLGRIGGDAAAAGILLEGSLSIMPSSRNAAVSSLARLLKNLDEPARSRVSCMVRDRLESGLLDSLFSAFNSGDRELCSHVVLILAAAADPIGVPLLIKALPDEILMPVAMKALLSMGRVAIDIALGRFNLADDQEKAAICLLIGRAGSNSESANSVVGNCLEDPSPDIRKNAAVAVGRLASLDLLSRVTGLLDDESQSVRDAALETLQLRSACDHSMISEKAMQMLASELPARRRAASLLFAAIGDSESLSRLIKDVDPEVREASVRAIGKMRLPGTCSLLVMALVDEEPEVRIAAAESLGTCSNSSAAEPLRLALDDRDPWVRAAAIKSLAAVAGRHLTSEITSLWVNGEPVCQLACLDALVSVPDPESMELICTDIDMLDSDVLKGVIDLLCAGGGKNLASVIEKALARDEWDVRNTALKALQYLPEHHIDKERLRAMLETEQHDLVRQQIICLLDEAE